MRTGSEYLGNGKSSFTVWAPEKKSVQLHIYQPSAQTVEMKPIGDGYFSVEVNTPAGSTYKIAVDGSPEAYPDPASHYQPEGVHGPSAVVDHQSFQWSDKNWTPPAFEELILYELHIGTFTDEGTFLGAINMLDHLKETGINAIEIMPVAQFPGERNWGYDGVYPYAVQNSYGGPEGLKQLVNACHEKGIAVLLDVVYNHQGPEGNYIENFAPYFTDHYKTPWGKAINFDGEWSDGVREFYCHNTIYWLKEFHIDGLRFDAIHAIYDCGAVHFWELLQERIAQLSASQRRPYYTIAESDLNAPKVIAPVAQNGFGFTAQWLDDFHHAAYVLLDPAGKERYADFGSMQQLAKAFCQGYVHSGEYVNFRKRKFGRSSAGISGNHFVAFINNHDQSGNRIDGARLCALTDHNGSLIATAMLLLSPYIPMLFMGEEYGDKSPFYYFISHSDPELIKAVQEGRKEEFRAFIKPGMEYPDPQSIEIFEVSRLKWDMRSERHHKLLLDWHRALIDLRKQHKALRNMDREGIRAEALQNDGLILHRSDKECRSELLAMFNISEHPLSYFTPGNNGTWKRILDSTQACWQENSSTAGDGFPASVHAGEQVMLPPRSVLVLGKEIV